VSVEPDLVNRGIKMFESELETLVEQYRGGPVGLPPQRLPQWLGTNLAQLTRHLPAVTLHKAGEEVRA
jgi:hypothetical protein